MEPNVLKQALLLRTLAIIAVAQVLPPSAVKGGTALKLRLGITGARFSRDLDLACRSTAEDFRREYGNALSAGWEGFTGEIRDSRRVSRPVGVPPEYVTVTYDLKIKYRGKALLTVPLEVSSDEINDTWDPPKVLTQDIADLFNEMGFPVPSPVAVINCDHQIAQKIHAVTAPGSTRAHDLVDLQLLAGHMQHADHETAQTCRRLFAFRRVRDWPPKPIEVADGWSELYSEAADGLPVAEGVEDAVIWFNDYVEQLAKHVPPWGNSFTYLGWKVHKTEMFTQIRLNN